MIKDVIEILKDISLRHKGVHTFRYKGDDLFNQQNNHPGYQVYVDDVSFHQLNITTNIFKAEFEIYVLGHAGNNTPDEILEVQNNAYTIACDIMAYIENKPEFYNTLSVYDYSILTLSHYTDDSSAGVKLSLTLQMPSPVDLCSLDDNFNDEPYEEDEDTEITIPENEIGELNINPIKLMRTNKC